MDVWQKTSKDSKNTEQAERPSRLSMKHEAIIRKRLGLGRHGLHSPTPYSRKGIVVRLVYMVCALGWAVLTGFGRFRRNCVVVLCYHGVSARQRERFERQMIWLSQRFRWVSITFDDAFENLLDNALPLLNELRIPAIVFAVPDNLGHAPKWNIAADHPEYNGKIMTAQQLKSIQNEWIAIGSHTQTHPDLSKLPLDQIRWELTESKKNLEQLLDKTIEDLALPHGAYNQDVLCIAKEIGYKRVYTLEPKLVRINQKIGAIGRFSMSPDVWPIEFCLTCHGAYSWLRIFRRSVRFFRGLAASGCRTSK